MPATEKPLRWVLHPDGSFDLEAPGLALRQCYPALDHAPAKPVTITVDKTPGGGAIHFTLAADRRLSLYLDKDDKGLTLETRLYQWSGNYRWLHPLSGGLIEPDCGLKLFRTGLGFSGPSGFETLSHRDEPWTFDSYLVTALVDHAENTLALGAFDHGSYLHQTHLENRYYTGQFRNRETHWNAPRLETGFALEGIDLPRGESLRLPKIHFHFGKGAFATLRRFSTAAAEANAVQIRHPQPYHICSWYWRTRLYCLDDLEALLGGLREKPSPIQTVQIDDGYMPNYGDWLETNERWPGGMQVAFEKIAEAGLRPGIWIGPFMVGNRSKLFRDHPDWMLHDSDGERVVEWFTMEPNGAVGGGNEECYRLDISHPEAFEYVVTVFRQMRDWGAQFFKTDFMEWAWKDSAMVKRHTPGKTTAQYYRAMMGAIRDAIGPDSYWLGCISYFQPMVGFCDGIRVSSDVHARRDDPKSLAADDIPGGIPNSLHETFHTLFFNNILFQNDPDVCFMRNWPTKLSLEEMETVGYFYAISGSSVNTSCPLQLLPDENRALWDFLQPQSELWTAHPPFFGEDKRFFVLVREYPELSAWAVLAINPHAESHTECYALPDVIGEDAATAFAWSLRGSESMGDVTELVCELPRHGHTLIYLSADGTAPPANLTLGGARRTPQ